MISALVKELENISKLEKNTHIFSESGMINKFNALKYGFFPLGQGLLSLNNEIDPPEIENCKIMVVGNDFGTDSYLLKTCKDDREPSSNSTIKNLLGGLKLDPRNTFYTNFYLGVRNGGSNTKRSVEVKPDFKSLCFEFFKFQVHTMNPQIVLCLGHEVRIALSEESKIFTKWKGESTTFKSLYSCKDYELNVNDEKFGARKFIISPHPCDARNFRKEYIDAIVSSINK